MAGVVMSVHGKHLLNGVQTMWLMVGFAPYQNSFNVKNLLFRRAHKVIYIMYMHVIGCMTCVRHICSCSACCAFWDLNQCYSVVVFCAQLNSVFFTSLSSVKLAGVQTPNPIESQVVATGHLQHKPFNCKLSSIRFKSPCYKCTDAVDLIVMAQKPSLKCCAKAQMNSAFAFII